MARKSCFIALLVVWLLIIACAPPSQPVATPSPVQAPLAAAPTSTVSPPTTQDAAWAKVVEAAKKEGLITIYGASQLAGDGGRKTIETFSSKYGIRVDMLLVSGRQAVERIRVESKMKQPIGDIAAIGLNSTTELSQSGLLEAIEKDLPELRNKDAFRVDPLYNPNGEVFNIAFAPSVAVINSKLVTANDEPKSYMDLLDPKWKKNIILVDPRTGAGGGFTWFGTMRYYKLLNDDYFRRFALQEPILWGGSTREELNMIARGEVKISALTQASNAAQLMVEGAPIKSISMTEGSAAFTDPISMVKGAIHPNATKLFINWLLSREGQEVYAKAFGVDSVRKDVPDFVDPRFKPQPPPYKLLPQSYDANEAYTKYHKDGFAESIFGKR